MFAIDLLVELDKIISGQRGLNGFQGRDRIRVVSDIGTNQRYDVLRKDHRLRIFELDVALL